MSISDKRMGSIAPVLCQQIYIYLADGIKGTHMGRVFVGIIHDHGLSIGNQGTYEKKVRSGSE